MDHAYSPVRACKKSQRPVLPAVYYRRLFVTTGGLISYGPDIVDQHQRAAGYVDRILNSTAGITVR
jgi:hypothetical protein